ncbi:vitamin D3 receptor B-like [Scylla paramamosain]|uniref:vitamin D3 receptor B-like n=1 Tax=Scylla paramamosain TaxID=85552 RepID=UPI0030838B0E
MIVMDERREMEGQEQKQSPNVSSSVVCVGEEFPSQECVAISMELQADHNTMTSTITSTTSASNAISSAKPLRTCRVCGDKAKSMHFGGLSCDSCKAFFRRAVHNDTYTNFTCPYDGTCVINITSRKCCQYCRYQKCLSIGMERSWVMSEEDRHQMMRQRAERKAKAAEQDTTRRTLKAGRRELVPFEPDPNTMLSYMSAAEWEELEQAVRNYRQAYTAVPHSQSVEGWEGKGTSLHIVSMFSTVVRRFAHFARLFPEFSELPSEDQSRLLRYGILEMSLIRGIQSLHTNNDRWPPIPHPPPPPPLPPPMPPPPPPHSTATTTSRAAPQDTKQVVSCELYEMHMKFVQSMRELGVDEPVLLLLLLVVLFSSDRPGLQTAAAVAVQTRQDHYLLLLRKYLNWRHGPNNAPILYPRLLLKLTDLRELNDQHTEYHLRMARQEVRQRQGRRSVQDVE